MFKKKFGILILPLLLCFLVNISLIDAGRPLHKTFTTALGTCYHALSTNSLSALLAAFTIHYCGQTVTNSLYYIMPRLEESIFANFISTLQTISSVNITYKTFEKISLNGENYKVEHFLGFILATYSLKPFEMYQHYCMRPATIKKN